MTNQIDTQGIVKYCCATQLSAFDLVSFISDRGGNVAMILSNGKPTRYVLSDYPFTDEAEGQLVNNLIAITEEVNDWDIDYFHNRMEL